MTYSLAGFGCQVYIIISTITGFSSSLVVYTNSNFKNRQREQKHTLLVSPWLVGRPRPSQFFRFSFGRRRRRVPGIGQFWIGLQQLLLYQQSSLVPAISWLCGGHGQSVSRIRLSTSRAKRAPPHLGTTCPDIHKEDPERRQSQKHTCAPPEWPAVVSGR